MSEDLNILLEEEDSGQRLDRFLAGHLEEWSRSLVQRWIRSGAVRVGGRTAKPSYRLRAGDHIHVAPPPPKPSQLTPEEIPLSIIFEDDILVVVDKPAGLVVHPGAGCPNGTLANALLYHFGRISRSQTMRPGLVHRLDKDTSGLLVVAKEEVAHQRLAAQFKKRQVSKQYLTLVFGRVASAKGLIDRAIGRHPSVRTKMSVHSRSGRTAQTEYHIIRILGEFSYLSVKLHTGRTHQIRVHLQSIGHPVVGDLLYAGRRAATLSDPLKRKAVRNLKRQFLHAGRLSFDHPISGKKMDFDSPLPADLADWMAGLE